MSILAVAAVIAERSVLAFTFILFCLQLICHELGYFLGKRQASRYDNPESVGVIVGGMLALLAFVLALTLSFATNRFSERRAGSMDEANAISSAWLRAQAIGTPRAMAIADLMKDYAQVRADFVSSGLDREALAALNMRTSALQEKMWGHLAAIVREQPNPVTNALATDLSHVFDTSAKLRFAFEIGLPPPLFYLLIGMAMLAMGCLGYQFGIKKKASHILIMLLTLMWTWVIVAVLDLASSRLGNIRIGTTVYEWAMEDFKGAVTIPPLERDPIRLNQSDR